MKPPKMLTAESVTAAAPSISPEVDGRMPPPMIAPPPSAVVPEIAFVTAISGECSAGATPHTTW